MTTTSPEPQDTLAARLADAVGRREIASAVGVGLTAVSNAVVRGSFPASWFFAVKGICDSRGIDCPPSLFAMKGATPSQNVDRGVACQPEGSI